MNRHILIADDDADLVDLLSRRCASLGLEVDTASNAMTALGKAEETLPDAMILDVNMPYGDGLSVCEMMASHEELKTIPVIILTGSSNQETVKRCHRLAAYYVPKCPDVWRRIEPLLRDLLAIPTPEPVNDSDGSQSTAAAESESWARGPIALMDTVFAMLALEEHEMVGDGLADDVQPRSDQPWILSIEDDDDVALALKLRLQEHGVQMIRAAEGRAGYRRAFMDAPRAILLDYELPEGNGDYVLRRLKESPATASVPVIVLTGRKEASIERQMRGLGADEFLTKPFDWSRLRAALDIHLDAPSTLDSDGAADERHLEMASSRGA